MKETSKESAADAVSSTALPLRLWFIKTTSGVLPLDRERHVYVFSSKDKAQVFLEKYQADSAAMRNGLQPEIRSCIITELRREDAKRGRNMATMDYEYGLLCFSQDTVIEF
jgi:hypothetical protein